ncbi:hypothetical protein [Evansella cellulosilytica]|uniref:Uncharacterized protein n=1 Tax=Evansella cellulosilytica (strain ATCC 21833 / DSM 2522 / FERM P-1141 / JCM 9156 / N-4) TaxID=649639 RepID=E6TVE1_EVAC2|nr:hypothetical protein [Evansella cellulosilytica]ADU30958.1 hypothetical protein Bcell_2703 [Evansella cellulosilytica DSM 2522]
MNPSEQPLPKKIRWIYFKQVFDSKFQANCLKAKIEDNWVNGYEIGPWVEIRKLKNNRYVVRYTYDE